MKLRMQLLVLGLVACAPVLAMGPVDGEVGAVWWANEYDVSTPAASGTAEGDAPGYRAELWMFKRYGMRALRYSSAIDELGFNESSDYTSVDLMWKAFSPTENNFFALGLGYSQMDLALIGLEDDTAGMRLTAEGRVGIVGAVHAYVQGAYLPSLDDAIATDPAVGRFEDLNGFEYELGVAWKMAPFVSMRAGYRETSVDFREAGPALDGTAESSGFLAGLGVHF